MELKHCTRGAVVQETGVKGIGRVGHIVGLAINHTEAGELVAVVSFAERQPSGHVGEPILGPNEMVHLSRLRLVD